MKRWRPRYADLPEESRRLLRGHERSAWFATLAFLLLYALIDLASESLVAVPLARVGFRLGLVVGVVGLISLLATRLLINQAARQAREQEKARVAREEAARLQGVLLAARTMEHHLNNQLALTVGYSELLVHHPRLPEELRPLASEALRGAQDAASTVARLAGVARLEEAPPPLGLGSEGAVLDLERSSQPRV